MKGPKQKIEVTCPRCDKGRVSVEVKVDDSAPLTRNVAGRAGVYAGSTEWLDHTCAPTPTTDV